MLKWTDALLSLPRVQFDFNYIRNFIQFVLYFREKTIDNPKFFFGLSFWEKPLKDLYNRVRPYQKKVYVEPI